ncbi:MAG: hypothetical protein GC139_03685 [Sideroxydans sp.]|nr:hypothetical protein [Sideroxydans sp.]
MTSKATQALRLCAIIAFLYFVYQGLFGSEGGSTQVFIGVGILLFVLGSCQIIDKLGQIKS